MSDQVPTKPEDAVVAKAQTEEAKKEEPQQQDKTTFLPPRVHEIGDPCDFTGAAKAQLIPVFSKSLERQLVFSYSVGFSKEALDKFKASWLWYCDLQAWVPFEKLAEVVPSLIDVKRQWIVPRSGGNKAEDGWTIAKNWRANYQVNTCRRMNGEPWYSIPLQKTEESTALTRHKWVLINDLRRLNKDALPDDIWDMVLQEVLPRDNGEPTDMFLKKYWSAAWNLAAPSSSELEEYKL